MAWPKIKNIIILILLGTNLCLLTFALGRGIADRKQQDQARENAISFLQGQGVHLDEKLVPLTMELQPQLVKRDTQQEQKIAEALLEGEVFSEVRGTAVYRYSNANGSVQFHSNGDFSAEFSGIGQLAGEQELTEHGRKMLKRLDFEGELLGSQQKGDTCTLTFRQVWEKEPLLNCQVVLRYVNGALTSITTGRRLNGTPEKNDSLQSVTVATALMKFHTGMKRSGDVYTQITEITPGYVFGSTLSEMVPLVPVWRISTDIGTFQLDITSGTAGRITTG